VVKQLHKYEHTGAADTAGCDRRHDSAEIHVSGETNSNADLCAKIGAQLRDSQWRRASFRGTPRTLVSCLMPNLVDVNTPSSWSW